MDKRKRTGKDNPKWKGGKTIRVGYVFVYMPEHPRANSKRYVREHILMAEKAFGKPLPKDVQIHHHGERSDNTQIVICQDQRYHRLLHARAKALMACGHVKFRKCNICKKYDDPDNLYIRQHSNGKGYNIYHRKCASIYNKKRYERQSNA